MRGRLAILVLFLAASCEKDLSQGTANLAPGAPQTDSLDGRASLTSWQGKILRAEDQNLFEKWASDLSRSPKEERLRQQQLAHLKRAEVLAWEISDQDLQPVGAGDEPRLVELPFFGKETLPVVAVEIRRFGEQSINLKGHLAGDPKSKVHLSLSNQSPAAVVEGPDRLYYYETFGDVVILREDEPGSQHSDFQCDCERHRAPQ